MTNWYWVVTNDNTVSEPFVSDDADLGAVEDWMFRECRLLDQWSGNACLRAVDPGNNGDPDDSLQNHLGLLVFSRRLQVSLNEAGIDRIQYLPIQVFRPDGTAIEGFCIANLLDCVTALELERSIYSRYPDDYFVPERRGQISTLRDVTLRRCALEGHDVIRLAEYPEKVYVSQRFRDVFTESSFTGLSFHRINLV